jgi:hypothetical protein
VIGKMESVSEGEKVIDLWRNPSAEGPIILWLDYGYEGWKPYSFDSVADALHVSKFGNDFVITRRATYEVRETNG